MVAGIAITSGAPTAGTAPAYWTISVLNSVAGNGLLYMSQQTISGLTLQYVSAGQLITAGVKVNGTGTGTMQIDGDSNGVTSVSAVRIGNNLTPP